MYNFGFHKDMLFHFSHLDLPDHENHQHQY